MIKKVTSFGFIVFILFVVQFTSISAQTKPDDNPVRVEKIKTDITKRSNDGKKRVTIKMLSGEKLKGYVSQTGADAFTLSDSKTGQSSTVAYRDVKDVGKKGLPLAAKIAIIGGVAAGVVLIYYIAAVNQRGF